MDAPTSDDNFAHGPTSSCLSAFNTAAETDPDGSGRIEVGGFAAASSAEL